MEDIQIMLLGCSYSATTAKELQYIFRWSWTSPHVNFSMYSIKKTPLASTLLCHSVRMQENFHILIPFFATMAVCVVSIALKVSVSLFCPYPLA